MGTEITIKDAVLQLSVSEQRIRTLCRQGDLEARKIGSSWLISEASVNRYGLKTAHKVAEDHPVYQVSNSIIDRPIALSFFSGAMGLDLGIEKAGFEIRLACESDKYCRQTIALNRPNTALIGNVNDYTAKDIRTAAALSEDEDIDLVIGGPPCQAFSTAGRRKGFNDNRGNVFLKYLELALELKPKYIVIENVRGLLSCPMEHRPHDQRGYGYPDLSEDELKGGALNFITNRLEKSKYGYSFNLYNAANFGAPQVRERVLIVCSRIGNVPPFLTPTHSQNGELGLPKWKTLRSCISGIDRHHHLNFPEKRIRYYKILGPGQNWRDLPPDLQKEAMGRSYYSGGGKTGFLRRLAWDKPAPTLVTHPAMPATDLAHPEENRPLSIEEYRRIQEFPDDWELAGPLMQQYKQVGNAVPLSLGFAVGVLVKDLIAGKNPENMIDFPYSRYKNTSHEDWKKQFNVQLESRKNEFLQQVLEFA